LSTSEYRHILRIAGKDIEGSKKIIVALSKVKGLGYNFSQVLLQSLNINPSMRVGFLTEKELQEIENAIKNPCESQIPTWYMNRRKDLESGFNKHLITSDLDFTISNDIEREKAVYSWRGYRHMFGLKVRGQCTRTAGRKGGAVGVRKTTAKAAPGAPAPPASASTQPAPAKETSPAPSPSVTSENN
jgi:small subunit ribosomal protein S13